MLESRADLHQRHGLYQFAVHPLIDHLPVDPIAQQIPLAVIEIVKAIRRRHAGQTDHGAAKGKTCGERRGEAMGNVPGGFHRRPS
ncbi:hypothetical protein S7S_05095 [Isoalcanivorax pacificus W11-5]|uniref:Uncharacterized protein n=1 Tax=Isoalcanivorax pacificus W11-5 TaxID=391936 RepID=A0A0B4XH52_9GAMM|nr:hypothetical protein S7S_05095 [Isoalcanivorax pacificus W11-5]